MAVVNLRRNQLRVLTKVPALPTPRIVLCLVGVGYLIGIPFKDYLTKDEQRIPSSESYTTKTTYIKVNRNTEND